MKIVFLICITLISNSSYSQSIKESLEDIMNFDDARQFYQEHKDLHIEQASFNTGNELTSIEKKILKMNELDVFELNGIWYKIMSKETYLSCKVRYIYFDGNKIHGMKLDSLRSIVIDQYLESKDEAKFIELVNKYTMDGNKNGGDLGWFNPDMMIKEFSDSVLNHKKGEIFKVDIPQKNWYYVVLKINDNKTTTNLSYLIVTDE